MKELRTNIRPMHEHMDLRKAWSDFLAMNALNITAIKTTAEEIHRNVNQYYDEMPYSYHTDMVCDLFMQYGSICFESVADMNKWGLVGVFGAAFHDTIEDARLTYNDVKSIAQKMKCFGEEEAILAADIVYALTNEKGKNRAERENNKYFNGIKETPYAACIKLCDRYANALYANARRTSMAEKYSKEMATFLARLLIIDRKDTEINFGANAIHPRLCVPEELVHLLESYPIMRTPYNTVLGDLTALELINTDNQ